MGMLQMSKGLGGQQGKMMQQMMQAFVRQAGSNSGNHVKGGQGQGQKQGFLARLQQQKQVQKPGQKQGQGQGQGQEHPKSTIANAFPEQGDVCYGTEEIEHATWVSTLTISSVSKEYKGKPGK